MICELLGETKREAIPNKVAPPTGSYQEVVCVDFNWIVNCDEFTPQPTREMEAKLNELTAKLKALNLTVTKVDDAVTEREKESLKRIEASLTKKINGIYDLKEEIE